MQLKSEDGYLDSRFVAAIDVLKQHWQGSAKERRVLVFHLLLSRIEEVRHLQNPGRERHSWSLIASSAIEECRSLIRAGQPCKLCQSSILSGVP